MMEVIATVLLWLFIVLIVLLAVLVYAIHIGNKAGFEMKAMFNASINNEQSAAADKLKIKNEKQAGNEDM